MSKRREAIPQATKHLLLYQAADECCVCKDARGRLQIHHIDFNPSNNDIDNLVPLCPNCHTDAAEGRSEHVQGLSADRIRFCRRKWFEEVRRREAERIVGLRRGSLGALWVYINHRRLCDFNGKGRATLRPDPLLRQKRIVDADGRPLVDEPDESSASSMDNFYRTMPTWRLAQVCHEYYDKLADQVLKSAGVADVSNERRIGVLKGLCDRNAVIYFNRLCYFNSTGVLSRIGRRQFGRVRLEWVFSGWDFFGISSGAHFQGSSCVAVVMVLRGYHKDGGVWVFRGTPLAMGVLWDPAVEDWTPAIAHGGSNDEDDNDGTGF